MSSSEPTPRSASPPAAGRGELRIALWLAAAAVLGLLPLQHGYFRGSDEVGVYETTESLAEYGDLAVERVRHAFRGRDGRFYSHFAPGQSVLALPFYAAGRAAGALLPEEAARVVAGPSLTSDRGILRYGGTLEIFAVSLYAPVATAALLALFYLLERRLGAPRGAAVAAALALGAGTYVATHAVFFLRHTTVAALALASLLAARRFAEAGGARWLTAASGAACAIPLVRLPDAAAVPGLLAYAAWVAAARVRRDGDRPAVALGALAAPALAAAAIHAGVNLYKWDTPWVSPMLAQSRTLATWPRGEAVAGFLWSPGASVFLHAPLLLLAPCLWWRFARTERAVALAVLGTLLPVVWLVTSFREWTGLYSAPGPRYLFVLVPPLLLPLGTWLARAGRLARSLAAALAAAGLAVQLVLASAPWGLVVHRMDYHADRAKTFLFDWERAPLAASLGALREGAADLWILRLARGFGEVPGHPGIAALLLGLWALLLAFCAWRLALAARSPERAGREVNPPHAI